MKILTDENGKVICHYAASDIGIEVEPPEGFYDHPLDWYYIDGVWTLDEESIAKRDAFVARYDRIAEYKARLAESDYNVLKFAESLLEVNSITEFLALIIRTRSELHDIVRQRAEWRKQINELEDTNGNQGD